MDLQVLPELGLMILKIPDFNSHWLLELGKFGPPGFQNQVLQEFIFPVQAPWCDSLFVSLLHVACPSLQ